MCHDNCFFDIEEKRIRTEICENTDLIFGNPVDNEIQRQPYIIYKQNLLTGQAKELAKENGVNPESILPDDNFYNSYASDKYLDSGNDYTSVYNKFWKQDGEVYFTRSNDYKSTVGNTERCGKEKKVCVA